MPLIGSEQDAIITLAVVFMHIEIDLSLQIGRHEQRKKRPPDAMRAAASAKIVRFNG